jgi:hypothetical protein
MIEPMDFIFISFADDTPNQILAHTTKLWQQATGQGQLQLQSAV